MGSAARSLDICSLSTHSMRLLWNQDTITTVSMALPTTRTSYHQCTCLIQLQQMEAYPLRVRPSVLLCEAQVVSVLCQLICKGEKPRQDIQIAHLQRAEMMAHLAAAATA